MTDNNENELSRGIFKLDGLTGFLIAVVGLVATLVVLGVWSVKIQNANSEVYYSVNQDLHAVKFKAMNNNSYRTIE